MAEIKERPRSYWTERQLSDVAKSDDEALAAFREMEKHYNRFERELSNEVAYFYQQYGADNILEFASLRQKASPGDLKLLYEDWTSFVSKYPEYAHLKPVREAMYKLDRYEMLLEKARFQIGELGAKEAAVMGESLKKTASRTYSEMGKALSGNVSLLDDIQADLMIATRWVSGQNYSDRIWSNKDKLLGYLDKELRNGIIRGDDFKTLVGHLKTVTGTAKKDAERLVRTESSYIANRANMQNYLDNGLGWYEYLAVEDSRTSDACSGLNGRILPLDKAVIGTNYPPLHPNCRSRALPVSNRRANKVFVDDFVDKNLINIEGNGKIKVNSQEVRKWYDSTASKIKDDIDDYPMQNKAEIAFSRRNAIKQKARDLMSDTKKRRELDVERPIPSFEDLLEKKMRIKGMSREEASEDIYKTATKTNVEVNEKYGVGGN